VGSQTMIRDSCFLAPASCVLHGMAWHGMRADATVTVAVSACVRRDLGTRAEGARVASGVRPICEEPVERGREKRRGMRGMPIGMSRTRKGDWLSCHWCRVGRCMPVEVHGREEASRGVVGHAGSEGTRARGIHGHQIRPDPAMPTTPTPHPHPGAAVCCAFGGGRKIGARLDR
jgi:hypothetical protein